MDLHSVHFKELDDMLRLEGSLNADELVHRFRKHTWLNFTPFLWAVSRNQLHLVQEFIVGFNDIQDDGTAVSGMAMMHTQTMMAIVCVPPLRCFWPRRADLWT